MSYYVSLISNQNSTGTSENFTTQFNKQLRFPDNSESSQWAVSLVSASVPFTFFNISEKLGNNKFRFKLKTDPTYTVLTIPNGFYSVIAFNDYLATQVPTVVIGPDTISVVQILPDDVQLKVVMIIQNNYVVDFSLTDTPFQVFGFDLDFYESSSPNEQFLAQNQPNITNFNDFIYISLSCLNNSYSNVAGSPSTVIYGFTFTVANGSAELITPIERIWMPISSLYYDNMTVRIINQRGELIDLNNETVIVNLLFKRISKEASLIY